MFKLSLVIPTYNRGEGLKRIIETVLESDISDFSAIEIIVVDDGSSIPAGSFLSRLIIPSPFILKLIRQVNAGPAAARNNGLVNAEHEIVVFIDDDILVTPDLLKKHAAGHQFFPKSVIYGNCPYEVPGKRTPAYRFLKKLADPIYTSEGGAGAYIQTEGIGSGNISIEKSCFPEGEFYKTSLRSPVAEEYELIARLLKKKIRAYCNPAIIGWHLQPATIESKCQQELKYGIGIAEVFLKIPYAGEYKGLNKLFVENTKKLPADSMGVRIKKSIKQFISGNTGRKFLLKVTKITEIILPFDFVLFPMYRMLCGCNLFAGVRQGIRHFGNETQ